VMSLYERLIDFRDEQFAADVFAKRAIVCLKKAAAPGLGFDDAKIFEFGIGFGDGVAIDAQLFGQRANRRKDFSSAQCSGSGGRFDLIDYLQVDGFAGFVVDLEEHVGLLSYDSMTVKKTCQAEFSGEFLINRS